MASKLIKLEDGTLVEVEVSGDEMQEISGTLATRVDATFSKIKPILLKTCRPIAEVLQELRKEIVLEQVEIELGLSFESEGNIYIAKANVGANLTVRMTIKNKE